MPRLFIAIDVSEEVRSQLAAVIAAAPRAIAGKWVRPAQIHLTLRFLGSVAGEQIPALETALRAVAAPTFSLGLAGFGVFPEGRRKPPRVLWAGVSPHEEIHALKAGIDAVLGPDPESATRGFSPHVTLARLEGARSPALESYLFANARFASPSFQVTRFVLYESRTLPTGAEYHKLAEFLLAAPAATAPIPARPTPFPDSLCHACVHHRDVLSKTSWFLMCTGLPEKYPRQPLLTCPGFQPAPKK
jgi:RNA 2',3'-cyclic 3'-phosphodiesterase